MLTFVFWYFVDDNVGGIFMFVVQSEHHRRDIIRFYQITEWWSWFIAQSSIIIASIEVSHFDFFSIPNHYYILRLILHQRGHLLSSTYSWLCCNNVKITFVRTKREIHTKDFHRSDIFWSTITKKLHDTAFQFQTNVQGYKEFRKSATVHNKHSSQNEWNEMTKINQTKWQQTAIHWNVFLFIHSRFQSFLRVNFCFAIKITRYILFINKYFILLHFKKR